MDINNVIEIKQIKEILLKEDENLYTIFIDLLKVVNKKIVIVIVIVIIVIVMINFLSIHKYNRVL